VLAVGGGVFADQEEFADALSSEPFGFAEDVLRLAGEVGAPEGGDGAERAAAVAPRGDFEVGDGTAGEPQARNRGPGSGGDPVRQRGDLLPEGEVSGHVVLGRLGAVDRGDGQQGATVPRGVRGEGASRENSLETQA